MSSVGAEVLAHERHFTYGKNVGAPDRRFPTAGRPALARVRSDAGLGAAADG